MSSSVSPLLKIPFIQRILLFSSVNPKDVIHHALVHSSWRECLIDFQTLDWIWSKYVDPILITREKDANLKYSQDMFQQLQHTIPETNASSYFTLLATLFATSDSHLWLMQYFFRWATTQLERKLEYADDLVIPHTSKLLEILKFETRSGFSGPNGPILSSQHTLLQMALKLFSKSFYKTVIEDQFTSREPLGMACIRNCPETVKFLIAEAKVPVDLQPLRAAVGANSLQNLAALEVLVREGNIDINDNRGYQTFLHDAVYSRTSKSVEMLLRCGATRNVVKQPQKESPLTMLFKSPYETEYGRGQDAYEDCRRGNQVLTQSYRTIVCLLIPLPSSIANNTNTTIISADQDDEFNSTHVQDSVVETILNETSYHTNSLFLAAKNKHHFAVGRMLDFLLEVQNRRRGEGGANNNLANKELLSPTQVKKLTVLIRENGNVGTKHQLLKKLKSF